LLKKGVMENLTMEGQGKNSNVFEKAREDMMEVLGSGSRMTISGLQR
jgi:hypothetical protein